MFEYDNTHVFNMNMIVTMENIVAEENIIFIGHCLYIQGHQRLHITTNDYHDDFLDFKYLQSMLYILCTAENFVIS